MEINLELLKIQNPWWSDKVGSRYFAGLKFDPVLETYNKQTLKWQPKILSQLNLQTNKIYLLLGVKGVGKTTIIKLLIKKLIEEKKTLPENIFYYSCHILETYEQLNEMIKIFLHWRAGQKERLFIFIDEITLLDHWFEGINYLAKAGKLKNTGLIFAGSSLNQDWRDKKSNLANWQPKFISSLDFSEFLNLINPTLFRKIKPSNFKNFQEKLNYYLEVYFLTGGFISALSSFKEKGAVNQSIYENYLAWLLADLAKMGRDIILARQILEKLLASLGRPIGYQTIAKKTKAKTHLTVAEYLEILEQLLIIRIVYQRDIGKLATSKAKKVYFTDPFFFWLFYSYTYGSLDYWHFSRQHLHQPKIFLALIENVVFSHLIKGEKLADWGKRVTFWRDYIKKTEIDFLFHQGRKIMPILISYDVSIGANEKILKAAGFKQGIIITKEKLDLRRPVKIIPLTYFLLFYKKLL